MPPQAVQFDVEEDELVYIQSFPEGVIQAQLSVTAQSILFDIEIYETETRTCLFDPCALGYQGVRAPGDQIIYSYSSGMNLEYDGKDLEAPITEQINIDVTDRMLSVYLRPHGNGQVIVNMEYTPKPCSSDIVCNSCDTYEFCNSNQLPVCDGSVFVSCEGTWNQPSDCSIV